ncbi:T-cell activation inhibitor, mitochondrial-like [Mytilus edulis]|uniref:T-cell activation inhibitor, mitochondrial-like n=1 Tax=Mytilus edulis TaxID=6550 RepID=UPI0039EE980D
MKILSTRLLTATHDLCKRTTSLEILKILKRHLTVSETATALRPFYLAVHPDFYGQFPVERKVNEESLKKLHEYITDLHKTGKAKPTDINFYVRGKQQNDKYKYVNMKLLSGDVRSTVTTVLESVALPLDYLDTIPRGPVTTKIRWDSSYYHFTGKQNPHDEYYQATSKLHTGTLISWLQKKGPDAKLKLESSQKIQEQINELYEELIDFVGLEDINWYSDWEINHYMGCLRSFSRFCHNHPKEVKNILKGRSLVFGNKPGVSLYGEVVLSSGDCDTDWMTFLSYVPAYDAVLERLPYMEKRLSELLGNIKIDRRKKKQIMMATEYELILNKILNCLRNCQGDVDRYFNGEDLSHLELVVEEGSAPMTLSSNGKFVTPSSIPGIVLVKFIAENKDKAYMILQDMALQGGMEKMYKKLCIEEFQLLSLKKEENVSPHKMIHCCERLLYDQIFLQSGLHNSKLNIAHYYALMHDGEMTIPWNWTSDIS